MKTSSQLQTIESSGFSDSRAATIIAGPAMFRLLSGLYSNPIRAVCREIICNAVDAHTAAGKPDKPIRVELPSALNPVLQVSDDGPGMSEDAIYNLFLGYGGTTKDDADDQIGGFGVGSKSPLCYTDSFVVTSRYHGHKKSYLIYLDETQSPRVTKVSDEPFVSANGIDVVVPVKPDDASRFRVEINSVLSTFPVVPDLPALKPQSYYLRTSEFGVRMSSYTDDIYGIRVICGSVAYPVSNGSADLPLPDMASNLRSALLHSNIDLFLPIGSVVVAPSREALIYAKKTVVTLTTAITKTIDGLKDHIAKALLAESNEWARYGLLTSLTSNLRMPNSYIIPDGFNKYYHANPVDQVLDEQNEQIAFIHRVDKSRRAKVWSVCDGHALPASKVIFVRCETTSPNQITRVINQATVDPPSSMSDYFFYQVKADCPTPNDVHDLIKGAKQITWGDFVALIKPVAPTPTPRAARRERQYSLIQLHNLDILELTCKEHYEELLRNESYPVIFQKGRSLFADPECTTALSEVVRSKDTFHRLLSLHDQCVGPRPTYAVVIKASKKSPPAPEKLTLSLFKARLITAIETSETFKNLRIAAAYLANETLCPITTAYLVQNTYTLRSYAEWLQAHNFNGSNFSVLADYLEKNSAHIRIIKEESISYRNAFSPIPTPDVDNPLRQMCLALEKEFPLLSAMHHNSHGGFHSFTTPEILADYLQLAATRSNLTLNTTSTSV